MGPSSTSIQSFFQPEVPSPASRRKSQHPQISSDEIDDDFDSSDIDPALNPTSHKWQPRTDYEETAIGDLVPGPGCVTLMGRIVNFYDQAIPSKMPQAARGCIKIIVKDDTGALAVSDTSSLLQRCACSLLLPGQAVVRQS